MAHTWRIEVAEQGSRTLEEIGAITNMTRRADRRSSARAVSCGGARDRLRTEFLKIQVPGNENENGALRCLDRF